jgi:hypothetical protein
MSKQELKTLGKDFSLDSLLSGNITTEELKEVAQTDMMRILDVSIICQLH